MIKTQTMIRVKSNSLFDSDYSGDSTESDSSYYSINSNRKTE